MTPVTERHSDDVEVVFEPELEQQLWNHAGKWVAATKSELLAVGDTPEDAVRGAKEQGHSEFILHYVPPADTTYFF